MFSQYRPRTRTHPIPTLFGFVNYASTKSTSSDSETHGILVINAAPGFKFNWVRYFSTFPTPRETSLGVFIPTPSAASRKCPFDLLGEVVLETTRLVEPYNSVIMNVHVSFFLRDLKFRRRAGRPIIPPVSAPTYTDSTSKPISRMPWTSCHTSGEAPSGRVLATVADEGFDIPLYLHHHEIRRLQMLNAENYPEIPDLQVLPAVTVKVCNRSQTKVETTGKLIPLKKPKMRDTLLRATPFVPSPGMRTKTSVKPRKSQLASDEMDEIGKTSSSPSSRASQGQQTVDLEKSTVDSLEPREDIEFFESSFASDAVFNSFPQSAETVLMGIMSAPQDIDSILHPSIKGSISSALDVYSDNIEEVFDKVYQDVCARLEDGSISHALLSDPVLISQSVWRGIQEVCCGGSLSPRPFLSAEYNIGGEGLSEVSDQSSTPLTEQLPALERLESFEEARSRDTFSATDQDSTDDIGDDDDIRSTNDTSSRLHHACESSTDRTSSPALQRSSVTSVRTTQSLPHISPQTPNSNTSRTFTQREEEYLHMHTRERILRRCSTELDREEATRLISCLESLRSQAIPKESLPAAFDEWFVVIPRPAVLCEEASDILAKHRDSLLHRIAHIGSSNFILNAVQEELIHRIESHLRKTSSRKGSGQMSQNMKLESDTLAIDVIGHELVARLGIEDEMITMGDLYDFMTGNLGVKIQAQGIYREKTPEEEIEEKCCFSWTSYVEQFSKFTWFTNETTINHASGRDSTLRSYKFLRPQLFRSPQFSPSLIARRHLVEAWEAIPCNKRKAINEQMTVTLNFGITSLESLQEYQWISKVVKEGSDEWLSMFKEQSYLPTITSLEWELLYCDFVLEGIEEAAVSHLRELA